MNKRKVPKRVIKIRRKRIRRRRRILSFLLLILILTLSYLIFFKTSFFDIKDVKVIGNNKIDYNQIIKVSNCVKNKNIFQINKKDGEKALELLPYMKKAKIKRSLPNDIIIEVKERKEIIAVSYIGSFVYVDDEGYILSIEEKDENVELPKVLALELIDLSEGQNLFKEIKDNNVVDFILFSNKAKILEQMEVINFSNGNSVTIELNSGTKIAFGPLNNIKYKISFLSQILKDIDEKNIEVKQILLNKGDNPIILTEDE